jgi:ectoine hydroxylase-related dioxygenase (phytanoyl-CoA dioxygenase family)
LNGPSLRPLAQRCRALSSDQLHAFWRNGYVVVDDILDSTTLNQLRDRYEAVCQEARTSGDFRNFAEQVSNGDEEREVMVINQVCERDLFFNALLYDPRILDVVEDLMGPHIQLFHDFLLHKPAEHGGSVFWHQDNQAWQSMPPNNITCWIALDDADAENGALRYIAGSHRDTLGMPIDEDGRLEDMDRIIAEGDQRVAPVRAGGAVFHHCLTIHGSTPNNSERMRRAHSIIFMQPGTRCGRKPPFNSRPATEGDGFDVSFGHPLLRGMVQR